MSNKKVRILVDQQIAGAPYRCNDVVDLPAEIAKPLLDQGSVDDNKAAVSYCVNELGATVIAHQSPVVEEPAAPVADPADPPEDPAL